MAAFMLTREKTQESNKVQEALPKAEGLDIPWEFFFSLPYFFNLLIFYL